MAASSGKKSAARRKSPGKGASGARKKKAQAARAQDSALFHEIGLIVLFAAMVFLFCCNLGIIGPVGDAVSGVLFGLFGLTAYAVPILLFLAAAFWSANLGNPNMARKLTAGVVLFVMTGVICDLLAGYGAGMDGYSAKVIYENCQENKYGGGILSGSIRYFLQHYLATIGTVLVVLLCFVVCLILLTEKSLLSSMKKGGNRVRELSREQLEILRQEQEEYALRRQEEAEIRRQEQEERAQLRRQEQEEQSIRRREQAALRRQEQSLQRERRAQERRIRAEEKENEKILRMERKVSGVILDTALPRPGGSTRRDDMHEIFLEEGPLAESGFAGEQQDALEQSTAGNYCEAGQRREADKGQNIPEEDWGAGQSQGTPDLSWSAGQPQDIPEEDWDGGDYAGANLEEGEGQAGQDFGAGEMHQVVFQEEPLEELDEDLSSVKIHKEGMDEEGREIPGEAERPVVEARVRPEEADQPAQRDRPDQSMPETEEAVQPKQYFFPPLSLLHKLPAATGDSARELRETAMRLQQTLATFGVKVTITDISQGPSVTRYELQPEQGVKVSKIVGLTDDIKLNLAATDIRIEAPIPGKAAVGIEVPNKENMPVALRDLLETKEFQEFPSNIAFAVGKDIGGKAVVSDIAKMPHMLIAGATGSGKSVCINTLIMSILYKAHPDDVKLIMVDPKVVELSVYNGIPHLLVPVVTDPKKASAALHWGVAEMDDRYKKFAEYNVRDLKGYNKKIEAQGGSKLPQIVIIVDELADLMMVAPGEVEESICRLAQLARAAGIHLIIATQRPSVDVITGLIKANMPSRAAFSVSSGVDSRTILDMVGAEKLLGKGDMLFYPQGYSKPARVQGAFVSDQEVSDVVEFLKNQVLGNIYAEDIEEKIKSIGSSSGGRFSGSSEVDDLFEKAGHLIIDKDKASIGMLQRALQIGFNRAARIMDQLCQYGVVGEEEGTKPRKILMSPEQFEQLLEEVG